jgi:tRNA(fMet)-specific endonuclease VapC
MHRYMLDTDTSSYIMRRANPAVLLALRRVRVHEVCISAITKCEVLYGFEKSSKRTGDRSEMDEFFRHVEVLDFPQEASLAYGRIRATLKRQGTMIGANDLFIAAHALYSDLTLVTNNTREFGRVDGLKIENWTAPLN